jgi:CDP-diacylglycerol--serine O-phosphatidyltransferase
VSTAGSRIAKIQHVLADTLTCCNLVSGVAATLLPEEGRPVRRSTLILLGAACDTLDGPLARRSGNPTEIGAAGDGIADLISFGVAPAALLASHGRARGSWSSRLASGLYVAAAAWRVVRYGIGPRTSHVFRGLPLTGSGILVAAAFQIRLPPRLLTALTLALSAAMVSHIRVLSGEALIRRDLETLDITPK